MLAASRTESVMGRIKELTSSISAIKGIKGPGVPKGTRWAKTESNDKNKLQSISPAHIGSANLRLKERCLEAVKV